MNPAHCMELASGGHAVAQVAERTDGGRTRAGQAAVDAARHWRSSAQFAADDLQRGRLEIDRLMQKHQLQLADRQCRWSSCRSACRAWSLMLATSLWASRQSRRSSRRRRSCWVANPPAAHRQASDRRGFPPGDEARGGYRRGWLRGHRGHRGGRNPDALPALRAPQATV